MSAFREGKNVPRVNGRYINVFFAYCLKAYDFRFFPFRLPSNQSGRPEGRKRDIKTDCFLKFRRIFPYFYIFSPLFIFSFLHLKSASRFAILKMSENAAPKAGNVRRAWRTGANIMPQVRPVPLCVTGTKSNVMRSTRTALCHCATFPGGGSAERKGASNTLFEYYFPT